MTKAHIKFEMYDEYTKCKTSREVEIEDELSDIIQEFKYFLIGLTYPEETIDKAFYDAAYPEIYSGN